MESEVKLSLKEYNELISKIYSQKSFLDLYDYKIKQIKDMILNNDSKIFDFDEKAGKYTYSINELINSSRGIRILEILIGEDEVCSWIKWRRYDDRKERKNDNREE